MTAPQVEAPLRLLAGAFDGYRRLVVGRSVAAPLPQARPVRRTGFEFAAVVTDRVQEAHGVVGLRLAALSCEPLPAWQPGAHVDLVLPSGRVRQYSLCGDPADRYGYRIAVRRLTDGRGGSCEVHDGLPVGAHLRVRGPRNAFRFVPAAGHLFVAGGIGITPILPMLRAASARGDRWHLVYLGRSRASMPFLSELACYGDRVQVRPDDECGAVDAAELDDLAGLAGGVEATWVCGPSPLIDGLRARLDRQVGSVRPSAPRHRRLHLERFAPPPVVDGAPLTVQLARSGASVDVAADETVLTAVLRAVPSAPYSCRQGFCGSCATRVLAGTVDGVEVGTTRICTERGEGLVLDM